MIHYYVQERNDVSKHTVNIDVNKNAKRYRIYWMSNHSGMFIQYLISQHKNFPQSSAYYITLPNKSHVIYKTDGQDSDTLIEPIDNPNYTKFIDSNPNGHEPWLIDNQTDVEFYIKPVWEVTNMRSDSHRRSVNEVDEHTFTEACKEIPTDNQSICIEKLMDAVTRAEEYNKLLDIIQEDPIEINSIIHEYKQHVEWAL